MNAPLVPVPAGALAEAPRYEAMRAAVGLCATIDEAREMRDRAAALAMYARQRDDTEVLVWLQEIKLRAGRRIGEILRDIERDRGGRPGPETRLRAEPSLLARAIDGAGLRRGPAYELQEIAGPQDPRLRAVANEAAEGYYARARAAQQPATQAGLRQAVIGAVHAAIGPDEIRRMGKALQRDAQALKAARRAAREIDLGESTRAAAASLGSRLYAVVYADPPWRFEVQSRETGLDRAADNHYPTMPTEEICALPVPAAPDCALFLWATAPMLEHGLQVLRAWGFGYGAELAIFVLERRPSRRALEQACRGLKLGRVHLPSIAEVMTALQAAEGALASMAQQLDALPGRIVRAEAVLERARPARTTAEQAA